MKKIVLFAFAILTYAGVNAQGFYLDANVGYGFGFPNNVLGQSTHTNIINGIRNNESKNLTGSIGQGLNVQLTPGYMINHHLGFELGINYFIGAKTTMGETTSSLTIDAYGIKDEPWSGRSDVASSNQLRISPAIFLSTGTDKKFSGYAKLGIIMPLMGSTKVVSNITNATMITPGVYQKDKVVAKTEVSGSPSFGFRGAVGLNFNISEKLSVFGELYVMSLNIKKKSQITKSYVQNGTEMINSLPKYSTDIEYMDKLDQNSNNEELNGTKDVSKPNQVLYEKTSFSQLGIQLGVKYSF